MNPTGLLDRGRRQQQHSALVNNEGIWKNSSKDVEWQLPLSLTEGDPRFRETARARGHTELTHSIWE